jgi:hypothetical protein
MHSCRQPSENLSELLNLQDSSGANIWATSRFVPDVIEKFHGSMLLEIRASEQDVQRYIEANMSRLPSFVGRNPDLREEIKTGIVGVIDGMYVARVARFIPKRADPLGFCLLNFT